MKAAVTRSIPDPALFDRAQAAAYLGITDRHMRHLRETGAIPAVKVGSLVRYRPADLDAFIEAHAEAVAG